jgi:putative PEP-CTERM system histidine kinase
MTYATAGYAIAAIAYGVYAALLLAKGPKSEAGRWVTVAALVTAGWAAVLARDLQAADVAPAITIGLEVLRYAAWFKALRTMAGVPVSPWLVRLSNAAWLTLLALAFVVPLNALLVLALIGLVLIEQLVRNAVPDLRAGMKLAVLGVGGQFAFDLFMYSQAQLLGNVDQTVWQVRGAVLVVTLPLIALALRRVTRAGDNASLALSRHMVFYTGALLALSGYLLLMSVGGYYVKLHGGNWGDSLRILFFVGAVAVLASLLFSETLWRRLRVFIATHFFSTKYDYRLEWLRFIKTLSATGDDDTQRAAVQAVAQIFEVSRGLLLQRDELTGAFSFAVAWPEDSQAAGNAPNMAADDAVVQLLEQRQWVIDLEEQRRTPAVYNHMPVPPWLGTGSGWRFVSPLIDRERLVGIMVLSAPQAAFEMTFEDRDLFKTVGRHIAVQLSQRQADQKLTESRQFDAYNRFSAFVMHDLKNSVAQLQMLVSNAARHRHNPQFIDDAISTISNTVGRMTRLIEQLQSRDLHGQVRDQPVAWLVQAAVTRSLARRPVPTFASAAATGMVRADAERLGSVLDHLIRNAQEAAGEEGTVTLRLRELGQQMILEIEDNGTGMEPEFIRERLFKPFDSTKGTKGMGIGAYQARDYVRQLGGEVEVQSSPGHGTHFYITLPVCQTTNDAS